MNKMWHKKTMQLVTTLTIILLMAGCGISEEKINEAINPAPENIQTIEENAVPVKTEADNTIRKQQIKKVFQSMKWRIC